MRRAFIFIVALWPAMGHADLSAEAARRQAELRGLRLSVSVIGTRVVMSLENVSDAPLDVMVAPAFFNVRLEGPSLLDLPADGAPNGPIPLGDPTLRAVLRPHQRIVRELNLARNRRLRDGKRAIAPGEYRVFVSYNANTQLIGSWWGGRLEAGPQRVTLP
jgi:hypothetical protein